MAQKVETLFTDDIDGSQAAETVKFSLDGKDYAIDLSEGNAAVMRETLAVYVTAGRRQSKAKAVKTAKPRNRSKK